MNVEYASCLRGSWVAFLLHLVHMKHIHPDIVVGEVVPEVEPRVDEQLLALMKKAIRWSRVCLVLAFVLFVAFAVYRPGWGVRIPVGGLLLVVWLVPLRRLGKYWNKKKKELGFEVSHGPMNWSLPIWVNIEYTAYAASFGFVLQGFMSAGDRFTSMLVFLGIMMFIGGICFSMLSRFAREPGQVCCVDCEYPLVGLTIPCGCPECGRMIYDASWTTDRPRVRSGWFVPVGVMGVAFGGLMMYSSFANPGLMYGPMPRAVLMQLAPTDRDAFDELVARPMDSMQADELIEGLIAGNEGKNGWDYSTTKQQRWLGQFVGTGRVSREQYERMYGRVADWVRIGLMDSGDGGPVRVGDEVVVRLIAPRHTNLPDMGANVPYFFRGFVIGDDAEPVGGGTGEGYFGFLDAEAGESAFQYVPRVSYVATEPGELVIRARLVVALLATNKWKTQIRWDDPDGFFEDEPDWSMVIDLEHRVEVVP